MNDESRPEAAFESSAKRSDSTVAPTSGYLDGETPWRPSVRGCVVVDLSRFVDDRGFVADGARSALTWPVSGPDGAALLVLLGRARWFSSWFWHVLLEGPRWSHIELRGHDAEGVQNADRAIRELFAEAT